MSRVLFIGDPHIRPDNGDEVDILIHEIHSICREKPVDVIVIGGDVMHYHERVFTQALNKALDFIDKMRKLATTYILVGNHDAINNSIFLSDHHWMNALKAWDNVVIVDDIVVHSNPSTDFILCPYVPPGRLIEAIETKFPREKWLNIPLIFAHQEIKGCRMGAILSEDGDEWDESYPILVSGHIHDHQRVGLNVYYPGTPLQHAFGDSDIRVVAYITLNSKEDNPTIDFLPLKNVPRKKVVHLSLDKINKLNEKLNELNDDKTKLKLKIDASNAEFSAFKQTARYKELIDNGVKIQLQRVNKGDGYVNNVSDKNDFSQILEELVKSDEDDIVKHVYNELFMEKMVIDLFDDESNDE